MAASTIGTNVVADEQELTKVLEKVLSALDNSFKTSKNNRYQKMMENLAKHVGNGGTLSYDLIDRRYIKEIETILQGQNIDYMLIPTDNGDIGIAVKSDDKEALIDAKEKVLSMSVEYTKEYHDMDKFMDNVKHSPQMKGLKIPVIECTNKSTRNILQQSLYESGVVACYSEVTDKLCIAPNKMFNLDGDLADSLLRASFDLSRCSVSPEYAKCKEEQLKYDRNTLNSFIKNAKKRNPVILMSLPSSEDKIRTPQRLIVNDKGDIIYDDGTANPSKKILSFEDLDNFDNATIYAHLSKFADSIRDMAVVKSIDYAATFEKRNIEYKELVSRTGTGTRPEYFGKAIEYSEAGKDIDILVKDVIASVNKEIADDNNINFANPQTLFNKKHDRIVECLRTAALPCIDDFLKEDRDANGNLKGLSIEEKKNLLEDAWKSIDGAFGNVENDIRIDFEKAKNLEEAFNKGKSNEKEAAKDFDMDEDMAADRTK